MSLGRNQPCPCGSQIKYKKCCRGKVDWDELLRTNDDTAIRHMTARGKNLFFMINLSRILGIDGKASWSDLKDAIKPDSVAEIHKLVAMAWPDGEDLDRVLVQESQARTGLYVGTYEAEAIARGLVRHSLYSDRILVVDPFSHPAIVRKRFSPVEHPELHITNTINALRVWGELEQWIRAGLVSVIRVPGDFDARLALKCIEVSRKRYESNPELKSALKESLEEYESSQTAFELKEYMLMSLSDNQIRSAMKDMGSTDEEVETFVAAIREREKGHPYFKEKHGQGQGRELIFHKTGASYEMAKATARVSGSHLVTDIRSRWREIEGDQRDSGIDSGRWTPFAKAVQNLQFKYLDGVGLDDAIRLRNQNRLDDLRSFFRRVWNSVADRDEFDDAITEDLSAELIHLIAEADAEWRKIDEDLLKSARIEGVGALGLAIATGQGAWAAGSFAAAQAVSIGVSTVRRQRYVKTHPAAFFLGK